MNQRPDVVMHKMTPVLLYYSLKTKGLAPALSTRYSWDPLRLPCCQLLIIDLPQSCHSVSQRSEL